MSSKLYCYVDESGQDTLGVLFVVSVVITADARDDLRRALEIIERETGKEFRKWHKTSYARRLAYVKSVFALSIRQHQLNFAVYRSKLNYFELTIQSIANALIVSNRTNYETIVLIDALPVSQTRSAGVLLRRAGVRTKKVRGIRRDETNALLLLADALCGFVRDVL